jgi:protein-tyrosine phosphatase
MERIGILFVCLGNICRSPSAEAIFTKKVEDAGLSDKFLIDSAGTSSYHSGEQADPRMRETGSKYGYDLTSLSRQVTKSDFSDFQYIIAMDSSNVSNLKKVAPAEHINRISLMADYAKEHSDDYVPDPYFGGDEGFHYVIKLLEDCTDGFLSHLREVYQL